MAEIALTAFPVASVTPFEARRSRALSTSEDVALVEAFRCGDRSAFESLVRRHQRAVLTITSRMVRDRDAAEDVAQRVFVLALERIDELRGAFRPWLLRIAVNLSKNHIRDSARVVRRADNEEWVIPDPKVRADDALHRARALQTVRSAMETLPRRQREVALLRIDGDLTFAEIAGTIGITENNAKVAYYHAVRGLQRRLAELLAEVA